MSDSESSVEKLRANLMAAGIGKGSALLLHSGLGDVAQQEGAGFDLIRYATQMVAMLLDLVGPEGTLMMSTDSIADPREFSFRQLVFEPDRMRSRRGMVTEVFRLHPGVIRSRHPWCNAAAWGRHAEWLMSTHLASTPFAMDRNSPWFKLTEINAYIVYIGVSPGNANICSVIPENVLGYDYPVGAHFDKPVTFRYRTEEGEVAELLVNVHVHDWHKFEMVAFFLYLDRTYGLHQSFGSGAERVILCRAKHQYDVLMAELDMGHPFIHVRYWL